jgi:hypothetical protein
MRPANSSSTSSCSFTDSSVNVGINVTAIQAEVAGQLQEQLQGGGVTINGAIDLVASDPTHQQLQQAASSEEAEEVEGDPRNDAAGADDDEDDDDDDEKGRGKEKGRGRGRGRGRQERQEQASAARSKSPKKAHIGKKKREQQLQAGNFC